MSGGGRAGGSGPVTPEVIGEVADAVGLREGEAGIRSILRELARREPVSVRDLSRAAGLPLPIVSAACNELRARGVVSEDRPTRLTEDARLQLGGDEADLGRCPTCGGIGRVVPDHLWPLVEHMSAVEAQAPPARVELDQAHCSAETAVLRSTLLRDAGALDGTRILLLGDDDLLSVAIADLVAHLGGRGPAEVVVVDVDEALVDFLADRGPVDVRVHDLRDPLPDDLVDRFDVVVTDPPYTAAGAALFLSRAVDALAPAPGRDVFLSFGSTRPDVLAAVQAQVLDLGFVIRSLTPEFNEYRGAGVLGGTSAMYHLRTADRDGPPASPGLYTSEGRDRSRLYGCASCGRQHLVGPTGDWATVHDLRTAGCPCGGRTFVPGSLAGSPGGGC